MPIKPTYFRDDGLHGLERLDLALLYHESLARYQEQQQAVRRIAVPLFKQPPLRIIDDALPAPTPPPTLEESSSYSDANEEPQSSPSPDLQEVRFVRSFVIIPEPKQPRNIESWTKLCTQKNCPKGEACERAHNLHELIIGNFEAGNYTDNIYKARPCADHRKSAGCLAGMACTGFHNETRTQKKTGLSHMQKLGGDFLRNPPADVRGYDFLAAE